mgnify:CR=1 FL=1
MLERAAAPAPGFAAPVTPGGYHWWYLDAMSDDGEHALTVIVFVGSVFSPYYAAARRRLLRRRRRDGRARRRRVAR